MIRIALLVFMQLCLYTTACKAQSPVFRNYSTQDGLPSSETYCVIQDSKGYIWISTDRGIVKFDGYTFRTFTNVDGLPDNTVFEIFEDNRQRIWYKTFSTATGYIKNDSVYIYPYNNLVKKIYSFQLVISLLLQNDEVWISKYILEKGFLLTAINGNGATRNMQADGKKIIYINNYGKCALAGDNEAGYAEIVSAETNRRLGGFTINKLTHFDIFASPPDSAHGFYICVDNKVMRVQNHKTTQLFASTGDILSLWVDKEKNIWIGYRDSGLVLYDAQAGYKKQTLLLGHVSPTSIIGDSEGGFWVTTLENGLYYLPPFRPVSYTAAHGLPASKVEKIITAEDKIFLLLANGGLSYMQNGPSPVILNSFGPNLGSDLQTNTRGEVLYMGQHRLKLPLKKQGVFLGSGKKIYVGERHILKLIQSGVIKFNHKLDTLGTIAFDSISRVMCAYETHNGSLMVGTLDGVFLHSNGVLQHLKTQHPLFGYRISDIQRTHNHHIAIATIGQGVFIINETDFSVTKHYTTADGLPGMMCNSILRENDTVFWVGTNKGLCGIIGPPDGKNATLVNIDVGDGIVSNEINNVCIINDNLWLATAKGVSVLPRAMLRKKTGKIPMYIEDIWVNGTKWAKNIKAGFSHRQNNISISFVGLYFQHPEKLLYKYRLKGGDTTWYYTTNQSIVYNSLSPGKYVFEVGLAKPVVQGAGVVSYSFSIAKPFYKATWFITLLGTIGALVIYWFVQRRIRFVRGQEQLKNDLNRFRDRALRDQMNPHFIYNSLNSIQHFILKNDTHASASLLSQFSQLMRLTFNNTGQEKVSLEADIEALKLYAALENLRFHNGFLFEVEIHPSIIPMRVFIPPLLIQPFVENAIVHGLAKKNGGGIIRVSITPVEGALQIAITDNGVGRVEAAKLKSKKAKYGPLLSASAQKRSNSGIKATCERINHLWGKNLHKCGFEIVDLHNENKEPTGTTVQFCIPVNYD